MSKLWGGRFNKETNPLVEKFTKSIHYDFKLALYDLMGSRIHVQILEKCGYLSKEEASKLISGLDKISAEMIKNKTFQPDPACEDVHSQIQKMLEADPHVGELALKLQTARSRNDQVAFSTRVYCKTAIVGSQDKILKLIKVIQKLSSDYQDLIIPGFTHMQHAQPVYLKDYLLVYAEMLWRDNNRLGNIDEKLEIKMGAGALAGTPIDAKIYEQTQGFIKNNIYAEKAFNLKATTNSLDSVSDRDFVIEIISALSIVAMHLSRLSEDLIIWATKEFDFIEIDDAFCTGSSLMPQKKNPDVLELIRGNAGRLYGNLVSVLTMMKGLPLTYNRDMQLDKEPLFNSFEIISEELQVLEGLIKTLKFDYVKIAEHLKDESLYATDLVYYLVEKGVPFKTAHTIIGELVNYSLSNKILIQDIPEDVLKEKFCAKIVKKEFNKLFDPKVSVDSKKSINRTAK